MCANRQPTLGSFGFIKRVRHRGVWNEIILPDISEQPKLECPHCDNKFKNQQGLTVHLKCKHGNISESTNVEINNVPLTSSIAEIEHVSNVDSEELQLGVFEAQDISIEPPAKRSRGQDSRRQYNSVFKAKIVSNLEAGVSPKVLAQKHAISKSMLSMWRLNKGKIMLAASNDHKKLLKIRPSTKYAELYRDLRKVFLEARSKGHRVDFNWIWSKARILYRQKTNDPNAIVRKHVIVNFIKRNDLRLRSRQRNRKLSKENFRLPMQQWHATTRERLIRTGCADSYNSKWGRYAPEQRFNVDQSPCPFVINTKKTYEMLEKKNPNNREHKVWISQPGSGLDKRQCTLQICFRPTGKQPRVAIIFNGKGKRISEDEKNAWHPDVDVYFQENAWADTAFSVEWVKRTLSPIVQHSIDRFVLFCDNLSAQISDEFKKSVSDLNGVCWYGLPNATDIWQPVDAGYAELLKVFLNQKHHEWLDCDGNATKWYESTQSFSRKERRILLTHWVGEAYKKLISSQYDSFRLRIWQKTGCLMTADGTEDHLVQPEGLPGYNIPPPSMIDPDTVTPGMQNPEPNENVDIQSEKESLLIDNDDEREEFEDNIADRIFHHELVGKQVKGLYENGWFIGKIQYFNSRLDEFKVVFEDDSIDYISKEDIDDVEIFLIN